MKAEEFSTWVLCVQLHVMVRIAKHSIWSVATNLSPSSKECCWRTGAALRRLLQELRGVLRGKPMKCLEGIFPEAYPSLSQLPPTQTASLSGLLHLQHAVCRRQPRRSQRCVLLRRHVSRSS